MNIHNLYPVIWKELKEMKYRSKAILGLVIFAVALLAMAWILRSKPTVSAAFPESTQNLTVSLVVYAQLFTMFGIGLVMINYAFYNERLEKTLEPLLCTPLNIATVWLGKVLAVLLVAFLWSIMVMVSFIIVFRLFLSFTISLSLPILLQIFIVSPLLVAALVELLGFLLLMFKNILVAKFISIFILTFLGANSGVFLRNAMGKPLVISWRLIALFLLISLGLTGLIAYCTRFLKKEKIII